LLPTAEKTRISAFGTDLPSIRLKSPSADPYGKTLPPFTAIAPGKRGFQGRDYRTLSFYFAAEPSHLLLRLRQQGAGTCWIQASI